LSSGPIIHCFGIVPGVLAVLTHGRTLVMVEAFDPVYVLETVGKALPHIAVKIIDPETGLEKETWEAGEICCRGYKVPKYVIFVDSFPLTASGKIQKFKLREQACEIVRRPDTPVPS
jgi:acyl-CoA synthetase (AMP-forming)/AMP-acid ligase II